MNIDCNTQLDLYYRSQQMRLFAKRVVKQQNHCNFDYNYLDIVHRCHETFWRAVVDPSPVLDYSFGTFVLVDSGMPIGAEGAAVVAAVAAAADEIAVDADSTLIVVAAVQMLQCSAAAAVGLAEFEMCSCLWHAGNLVRLEA